MGMPSNSEPKMIVYDEEALQRRNLEEEVNNEFAGMKRVNSNDNLRIKAAAHHVGLPEPPKSGSYRPPMKIHDLQKHKKQPPRLLHPILHRIPLHVRFGLNGFISNVLFMVAYNEAVVRFSEMAPSSTIYSITYLFFIPVSHAFLSILVFGWPERYLPSLLSNTPIGVTAIILGAVLTEYLDENDFNKLADDIVAKNWKYLGYEVAAVSEKGKGEFYSSLLVLFVTGIWTYFLSVFVNSSVETTHKKEL
ncbi:unnamed protein product [Cylindrotheca closterium]|uniref:Uncharacterized protein n=1 Tax=Cylindrotheca closterium TaxID=2856 RepID=A0AAD2FI27_9STRA|nr:unnamed protein product [Cylindrotheca closterium]